MSENKGKEKLKYTEIRGKEGVGKKRNKQILRNKIISQCYFSE